MDYSRSYILTSTYFFKIRYFLGKPKHLYSSLDNIIIDSQNLGSPKLVKNIYSPKLECVELDFLTISLI